MVHQAYLFAEDTIDCQAAKTFAALATVALRTLERMPQPIGQVCGPISTGGKGSIKANLVTFAEAIEWLQGQGRNIFNQMPFEEHIFRIIDGGYNTQVNNQLLEEFYLPIFASNLVTTFYFIPGWESSHGATWEHEQIQKHGYAIEYLQQLGFPEQKTL